MVRIAILIYVSIYIIVGIRVFQNRSQLRVLNSRAPQTSRGQCKSTWNGDSILAPTLTQITVYSSYGGSSNRLGQSSDLESATWLQAPEPAHSLSSTASSMHRPGTYIYNDNNPGSRPRKTASTPNWMLQRVCGCWGSILQSLKEWEVDEVKFRYKPRATLLLFNLSYVFKQYFIYIRSAWTIVNIMFRYTVSAILLITSILITWVPPTVTRMYNLYNPKEMPPYSLGLVTSSNESLSSALSSFLPIPLVQAIK